MRSELRRERLRLQIAELSKPYYARPEFWTPMVPIILALLAFISAWWTGYFNREREELTARVAELTVQVSALEKEKASVQQEIDKASEAYRGLLREFAGATVQRWLGLTGATSLLMGTHAEICSGLYTYGGQQSYGDIWTLGGEKAGDIVSFAVSGLQASFQKTVGNYPATALGTVLGPIADEAKQMKFDLLVAEIRKRDMVYLFDPERLRYPFYVSKVDQDEYCINPGSVLSTLSTQRIESVIAGRNAAAAALRGLLMIANGEIDKLDVKQVLQR